MASLFVPIPQGSPGHCARVRNFLPEYSFDDTGVYVMCVRRFLGSPCILYSDSYASVPRTGMRNSWGRSGAPPFPLLARTALVMTAPSLHPHLGVQRCTLLQLTAWPIPRQENNDNLHPDLVPQAHSDYDSDVRNAITDLALEEGLILLRCAPWNRGIRRISTSVITACGRVLIGLTSYDLTTTVLPGFPMNKVPLDLLRHCCRARTPLCPCPLSSLVFASCASKQWQRN